MALKQCKECDHKVSSKADSCPNCGAVLKPKSSGCVGCLVLLVIGMVVISQMDSGTGSSDSTGSSSSPANPKTPEEIRKERIEKHFSGWDGSHRALEKLIKSSMNDPDSYDHDETIYWDMDDHLVVKMTFRGKNAFGGVIKNWVKASVSLDGEVLEVIEQGP